VDIDMKIEISNGELLDKLTILEIKQNRIKETNKLFNINKELKYIKQQCLYLLDNFEIKKLYFNLKNINKKLWNIEDHIRLKEKQKIFDKKFIELARSVYITNDKRAAIKKDINILSESSFIEEKSYEPY
jgi:hypothetical protein